MPKPLRYTTIYALLDPDTKELRYIGKTGYSIETRLKRHISESYGKGPCRNTYRCNWIRSLVSPPVIKALLLTDHAHGSEMERMAISQYRADGFRLVNSTDGGEGILNAIPEVGAKISASKKANPQVFTPELRQRLSAAASLRRASDETRAKMSAGKVGKRKSPETIARMCAAKKGTVPSEATRKSASAYQKGRKRTPEWIEMIRAVNRGNKYNLGRQHSTESKAKMSAFQKTRTPRMGFKQTPEWTANMKERMRGNQYALGTKQSPESVEKRIAASQITRKMRGTNDVLAERMKGNKYASKKQSSSGSEK